MTKAPTNILIVEDEADTRRFLSTALQHGGYRTIEAASGSEAFEAMRFGPNLVLLDLGLPDIDGLEVTANIREQSAVPIIVISARHHERAKIEALDIGANDYVMKPISMRELLARIRAALRVAARSNASVPGSMVTVGILRIDLTRRQIWRADEEVSLTSTEFDLLSVLTLNAGRVVKHAELLRSVWGPEAMDNLQYLRVFVQKLRHKLEPVPAKPRYLTTVSGVGYRLRLNV